jgi:nicotinamidase-related amidase
LSQVIDINDYFTRGIAYADTMSIGEFNMLLDAEECQLVLVDFQVRLMPVMLDAPAVVANAVRLARAAALLKVPVFASEQNPSKLGASVPELAEALAIANDTLYGLGAGVWTRDINTAYRFGREIQAGRVWTNCYHAYPAHATFGGYKQSGIGRETHKMMLDHYQQVKNVLVSYSPKKLGFF